ncbi:MAG: hypothetical protein ABS35_19595 [Kaistia sp. SCN 65-12]|nr:MAG: hypothetical protein ABS35_19595 [Kaistia sp. SCN 65-12]
MTRAALAIAAHAATLSVESAEGASAWVQLLPIGSFQSRDGRYGAHRLVDRAAMGDVIAATLKRAGATEIVVDYDHQTVYAARPEVGGTAIAAGWIKQIEARDDGIWGRVAWTAAASAKIRAGEYRYLSPVYSFDAASGDVGVIISAALTNSPNLDLAVVTASALAFNPTTGAPMKSIAKALGLAEDADEAAVLAAVTTLQGDRAAVASAAGLATNAATTAIVTAIQAATPDPAKFVPAEQVATMQTQLSQLQAGIAADKAETAVQAAISAGKLIPALKDWGLSLAKSDPAAFADYVAKQATVVAPGGQALPKKAPGDAALSDGDRAVMSALGLTEEQMLASKKTETE